MTNEECLDRYERDIATMLAALYTIPAPDRLDVLAVTIRAALDTSIVTYHRKEQ